MNASTEPALPGVDSDFETQCLRHRSELYATAVRMTRHPEDARDLVQETFVRAYAAWPRFRRGTNSRAWLFRIMTNCYINTYRRQRRHSRFHRDYRGDAVAAIYGDPDGRAATPEDEIIHGALGDEVTAALAELGPDYRQVVELADLRGLCYRDIARRLGLPLGTVMSRLFRARRKLEHSLAEFAARDYGLRRAA